MTQRPLSPILLGCFFVLATAICALSGLSLLFPDSFLKWMWTFQPEKRAALLALSPWSAIGLLALAAVMAVAAKGTYQRRHWGWFLAISIFAMNGALDLSRIVSGAPLQGLIGVTVVSLLLWWLTRPKVKASFLNQTQKNF